MGLELISGSNESANLKDSVNLIVTTLADMFQKGNFTAIEDTPSSCKDKMSSDKWEHGMAILE